MDPNHNTTKIEAHLMAIENYLELHNEGSDYDSLIFHCGEIRTALDEILTAMEAERPTISVPENLTASSGNDSAGFIYQRVTTK